MPRESQEFAQMIAASTIRVSFPEADIAMLTFDMPDKAVNILTSSVMNELAGHLEELEQREDLAGLVLNSGKPGSFIAGADIREFAESLNVDKAAIVAMCERGQKLFRRLSQAPFVTVAAIDGICVGGAAELAVWCDRRIMSSSEETEIGFPEVKLGLYPGWGGTVRTPRMIGLSNAIEIITGGESVNASMAVHLGLASQVASRERLLDAAVAMIREEQATGDYRTDRTRWERPITITETELGFLGSTATAYIREQTKGHYPAPLAALELMLESASMEIGPACQREAEGMTQLFGSPINEALINVFFLRARNKKVVGTNDDSFQPSPINSVSVVGAGIMGSGIAAATIKRELPLVFTDASAEVLQNGAREVMRQVSYNRETKSSDAARAVHFAPFMNLTHSREELTAADVLIEAVVENADVKRQVLTQLESGLSDRAILASNTSTIPISSLAEALQRPDRFCGIHFFNPVRQMKLVEVIRGEETSEETIATAVSYVKRVGKSPIVINDGPGFLVNRLLLPYMLEAVELLCEGASIKEIDRAARAFGMPMGPITLYDVVGLDTACYAGSTMYQAFPDRIIASPVLPALVKSGRLGQKSGAGFFSYSKGKRRGQEDPGLQKVLEPYLRDKRRFSEEELQQRMFLPMVLEATRILEEGIVRDVRDVDLGLILGLGFPAFKGGLLFWADRVGTPALLEQLKNLEALGERIRPTPRLLDMGRRNARFYDSARVA
jgi:3-hydroxyacyl-CoA dehydrogenase/enoyl-CoA hydratase/carnithine racemase